jgi:hypothetical protein
MFSFDVRSTFRALVGLIAIAVAAQDGAASAQPSLSPAAEDAVEELVAAIGEIQSRRGGNAPELIEPLTALSLLYEEHGDDALALALIERTTQVIEVNLGLHTLDEAQLMRRSIRIERARGNAEAAWDEEQELLRLIRRRRHQADARTVPIFQEIADHRRAVLARYRVGEFPPEIVLGCYYSEWAYDANGTPHRTGCRAGSRDTVILALRREAENFYAEAAAVSARIERWTALPCRKPAATSGTGERRSKQATREEMQAYFRAVSDYAGCTQAKYEYAAIDASPEELARLASDREAAAEELAAQAAIYNTRFGPSGQADRPRRRGSAEGS